MPVSDALQRVLADARPLPSETVALDNTLGRVLTEDLVALRTQPPAAVSAMDGYAVRAADVATAPVTLKLIAEVAAGLNKPVRICGEISSNPFYAVLLVGMGFTQLSMNPLAIPTIRKVIQGVSLEESRAVATTAMTFATAKEVGEYLIDAVSRLVGIDLLPFAKEITASSGSATRGIL